MTPNFSMLTTGLKDMLHLFFPELCVACEAELPMRSSCFCIGCHLKLLPSDMYLQLENEFTMRFWGRLNLHAGAAYFYFNRRTPIQHAFHQLKYHNQPGIGVQLGQAFGRLLARSPVFAPVELIVPVPLHPRKEKIRGYNQSAMIAKGLSETMDRPFDPKALRRTLYNTSQTKKKRLDRFQNVSQAFELARPHQIEGKHILLVDDVLTTGATLEHCGRLILEAPGSHLSMATLAIAML